MANSACRVYDADRLAQSPEPVDMGVASTANDGGAGGQGGAQASQCEGGECWWSHEDSGGCRAAGVPLPSDRPAGASEAGPASEIYLGLTHIRLGATHADGTPAEDAWQAFGFDLDGLCTNSSSCDGQASVACHSPGPGIPYDGQLCRDNTLGRLQPVMAMMPAIGDDFGLREDAFNCELWRGGYNMLVRVSGYNGRPDDPAVRVDYYMSTGLEESTSWTCPADDYRTRYPRWRSAHTWAVDESGLSGAISKPGSLPNSKFADTEAYVKNDYLVARVPDGTPQGFLGTADSYRGFVFTASGALFVGRLQQIQDGTWEISDGLLGGRIAKTGLVKSFREAGFCETSDVNSFYQSVLALLDETADVLADGAVDANRSCDAVSYAIAFDASQLLPGQATQAPPRIECCAPGARPEDCLAECGDGEVNGAEKCDTGIPAGMPGACPTACGPTAECAPQQLSGSACATECKPLSITMVGAQDDCCPASANMALDSDCTARCGNGVVETGETCDPPSSCPQCVPVNSCFEVMRSGGAETCNVRCEPVAITKCADGDGCCPAGCTLTDDDDDDCPSSCGDRLFDQGESCENGSSHPCPTGCADPDDCTTDLMSGSAANCKLTCTHVRITAPQDRDGCCPAGASANVDSDCEQRCGNGVAEPGEQCDDRNDVAGDGCFDCATEDLEQICLIRQGPPNDACEQCTCSNCAQEALDCYAGLSATDSRLCSDLLRCERDSKCGNPDCYCGDAGLPACLSGTGNGICKEEIEAAAESTSLLEISVRGADLSYPLGRANAVFTCQQGACASECGIQ